jgi:hypothetical protein
MLWDVASSQTAHELAERTSRVLACAFSTDRRLALSASNDCTLRLWDLTSGCEVARYVADAAMHWCAFSPGGTRLVSRDSYDTVHFLTIVGLEGPDVPDALTTPAEPAGTRASVGMLRVESFEEESGRAPQPQGRRRWPFGQRR